MQVKNAGNCVRIAMPIKVPATTTAIAASNSWRGRMNYF
jgi:hypothetical protein